MAQDAEVCVNERFDCGNIFIVKGLKFLKMDLR